MSNKLNYKIDSGKYAGERFSPKVPMCSKSLISLLFDGKSLSMTVAYENKKNYQYPADSGKVSGAGRFDYSLARQKNRLRGRFLRGYIG